MFHQLELRSPVAVTPDHVQHRVHAVHVQLLDVGRVDFPEGTRARRRHHPSAAAGLAIVVAGGAGSRDGGVGIEIEVGKVLVEVDDFDCQAIFLTEIFSKFKCLKIPRSTRFMQSRNANRQILRL